MNILVFLGSPRVEGNSEILLKEALKAADSTTHEVLIFRLNTMDIKPCQNCGGCDKTGICVINDDMQEITGAIRKADRVILSSPIFFFGLSAQSKIMIDRCQSLWCEKYLLKKTIPSGPYGRKGLLMLVGGMKKDVGIQCSEVTAKAFFRTISVPDHETLGFLGVDAKGAIRNHPTALHDASEAAKRLLSNINNR
jgi:multimeric flavodoxin WrbA